MAVQVNFGDEISVWRLPRHDTLGKIATEYLVVTVAHSCRVCHKAEDGSNLGGESNYFRNTGRARGRVGQRCILQSSANGECTPGGENTGQSSTVCNGVVKTEAEASRDYLKPPQRHGFVKGRCYNLLGTACKQPEDKKGMMQTQKAGQV